MTCKYAIFSTRITIDSTNDTLNFKRDGLNFTANLSHGNFYIYGDATELLDFLKNVKDAMSAADGGSTYFCGCNIWTTPTRNTADIWFGVGAGDVQILTSGTFNTAEIGFTSDSATSLNVTSDSTPISIWMSDQPYFTLRNLEVKSNQVMSISKGGQPYFYKKAVTRKELTFNIKNTAKRRTVQFDDKLNLRDSFEAYFEHLSRGVYVKIFIEESAGVITAASAANVVISGVLDVEKMQSFTFSETAAASALYNWDVPILEVLGV